MDVDSNNRSTEQIQQDSSDSIAGTNTKWDTIRRAVKRQALQLIGLEHSELLQQHQDAVQRSIVIDKLSHDISCDPTKQSIFQPSLFEAIAPHEQVSPLITHSLLRHLKESKGTSSTTTTPIGTMNKEPHPLHLDDIELDTLSKDMPRPSKDMPRPSIQSTASEPSFNRFFSSNIAEPHPPDLETSLSLPTGLLTNTEFSHPQSSYLSRPTGRLQTHDITEQEIKPDLWKIAYYGMKFLAKTNKTRLTSSDNNDNGVPTSFDVNDDISDDEDNDYHDSKPLLGHQSSISSTISNKLLIEDHGFFGHEVDETLQKSVRFVPKTVEGDIMGVITEEEEQDKGNDEDYIKTDLPSYYAARYESPPSSPSIKGTLQRQRINTEQPSIPVNDNTQYRPPFKILGGKTLRLLRIRYRVPRGTQQKLEELEEKGFLRPFFTYWLMTVHVIILVFALSVYGFAPYGFDQLTQRSLVQQSNLAVEVVERIIIRNIWGGPPQSALVLLGATYGPCMRRDNQLYEGVESDIINEGNNSGCCVRRDQSGCVQVLSIDECPSAFADFVYTDPFINTTISPYTNRAVCGTSPLTCTNPDPSRDIRWHSSDITEWPICTETQSINNQSSHLTCAVTGRPCCVGIQAQCIITTQEHCQYLQGIFHSEAFLCSQVDCLGDICGLLPFVVMNHPDQIYRLFTAIFLHAGIIHLVFTLAFHFLILRHVEKYLGWFRTSIIYIGSGIGGNLVSILFVPYNPEVGPAGGIFGIIAFFLIYIMYQAHRLIQPWKEALKLLIVILILIGCGLFPFIDNYAHFGGFVFGILLSGIFVPYYRPNEAELEYYITQHNKNYNVKKDWIQISKYLFLSVGTVLLFVCFSLFLLLFYLVQNPSWIGFTYLNCIPFTPTFCLDFQQNIRSRDIIY